MPSPPASVLASLLGRLAIIGLKGATAVGWRSAAACFGVLGTGWIVSAIPQLLDNGAQANAPIAASVTGSLSDTIARTRRPEWAEVQRGGTTFALSITELDGQPVRLLARRDINSQAREDQLRTGSFSSEATFAQIALKRLDTDTLGSFFVDMSRHASEGGLSILRSAQALPVVSKFGALETADMLLSDGTTQRNCLAFRHVAIGVSFGFRGWLCGTAQRAADRQQLTCLIERVTLLASGDDRQLRGYFSKAELQRQPQCLAPKLQAAGRKTSWLDPDQSAPALRRNGG
ncbi:MAG: hypothetical protein ACRCUE_01185 [Bosea sp. (in: a-proteobacteria)]